MITTGYKKVGDCTYPTLTGHTLRRKNIKLIQLLKAIKSNVENDRKLNNSTIKRNINNEFPSNNIILDENISKDINAGSGCSSFDVFADEGSGREGMESSSSSAQFSDKRNREEKNVIEEKFSEVKGEKEEEEDENNVNIYKEWERVSEPLETKIITHSASEESNCVLDVD